MSGKKRYRSTALQREIWGLLGGRCEICGKKAGKGFTVHHLWYIGEGEVKYDDYKTPGAYWKDLREAVTQNGAERFALLCRNHHFLIEWVAKLDDKSWGNLAVMRRHMKAPTSHGATLVPWDPGSWTDGQKAESPR